MIHSIKRASVKQILSARSFDFPSETFEKRIVMLGGSTTLNKRGNYFEGDLSGISAKKIPFWFQVFYKPGRKIAKEKDWDKKLNDIARRAPAWDVSIIVGVPAWIQIMLERIIQVNDLESITTSGRTLFATFIAAYHTSLTGQDSKSYSANRL
jgi:hypothetical protein